MADDDYYEDHTLTYDDSAGLGSKTMKNIDDWIHYELSVYMLKHARAYNFSPEETKRFQEHVLKFVRRRRSIMYHAPRYVFLVHVAGTVNRPVNHFIDNLAKQDKWADIEAVTIDRGDGNTTTTTKKQPTGEDETLRNLRARLKTHAENVAQQKGSALDPDDLIRALEDLEISGVLRYTPQLAQARDKVLVDLSGKRDGARLTQGKDMGFHTLIEDKRVLVKLAELVGYQVLMFDQLAPRRAYKEIDYARISSKHNAAWTALLVLLGQVGARSRFTGRRDMRGFATGFLDAGVNFKSW